MSPGSWQAHVLTLVAQRPTLSAHIERQSATGFALDQKRELYENASATHERRPRACQFYAFLAIRLAISVGKAGPKPRPQLRNSSSQFLHVFILVPKSRFDLTIRMTGYRSSVR